MKIHFLKAFQKIIASKSLLQNVSQGTCLCVELATSNCFLTSDMEALGFDMWFTALLIPHNKHWEFSFLRRAFVTIAASIILVFPIQLFRILKALLLIFINVFPTFITNLIWILNKSELLAEDILRSLSACNWFRLWEDHLQLFRIPWNSGLAMIKYA